MLKKEDLRVYKQMLDKKREELVAALLKRDRIIIEQSSDPADEVSFAQSRDLAITTLDRESSVFRQVDAALAQIKKGSYGVCSHCEDDIHPKRLNAVPWTGYCLRCQEAADAANMRGETLEKTAAA